MPNLIRQGVVVGGIVAAPGSWLAISAKRLAARLKV